MSSACLEFGCCLKLPVCLLGCTARESNWDLQSRQLLTCHQAELREWQMLFFFGVQSDCACLPVCPEGLWCSHPQHFWWFMDCVLGMALHTNTFINFAIIIVVAVIITFRRTSPTWYFTSHKNLRNGFGYNWNPLPQIETAALGAISESFVIVCIQRLLALLLIQAFLFHAQNSVVDNTDEQ